MTRTETSALLLLKHLAALQTRGPCKRSCGRLNVTRAPGSCSRPDGHSDALAATCHLSL